MSSSTSRPPCSAATSRSRFAARVAVTLWIIHCHAVDAFESTPRLALLSPEKGSGKTRTLEVLALLVPGPMHAVNMTAAALYRVVADQQPTLLLDEADTYLGNVAPSSTRTCVDWSTPATDAAPSLPLRCRRQECAVDEFPRSPPSRSPASATSPTRSSTAP